MYRTIAKTVFWEFDSIVMQNLSDILPLFCTPTWPSHHVSENQELTHLLDSYFTLETLIQRYAYFSGYEVGQRYTHSYECDVTNAMPGSSTKTVGLQFKCDAHVDVIKKTEMQVTVKRKTQNK